ncbi:MAG: EAL domain-containing protein [Lachnospiraceae bacterium]|nr:EAL domain-containing protein [Lachnospiraceae bacterium]MEE3461335.1 EAL domain-containing protein [Lachnospiraceae bacterium]
MIIDNILKKNTSAKKEAYIVQHIDEALDKGIINVIYKPVVRTLTNRLTELKAYACWNFGEEGVVGNRELIRILSRKHLNEKLDLYIMYKVFTDIRKRIDSGRDTVPVAVNFSADDLNKRDFSETVIDLMKKADIGKEYIHFEINENTIGMNSDKFREGIKKLNDAGISVYLGNFGSGNLSIELIEDNDIAGVVTDDSFFDDNSERSERFLKAYLNIAVESGLKTIVEGVKNKDQLESLKRIGCGKAILDIRTVAESYDSCMENAAAAGFFPEKAGWKDFYDSAYRINFKVDTPFAVLEDDSKSFHFYYMNGSYMDAIYSLGVHSPEEAEFAMNTNLMSMSSKLRKFLELPKSTGKRETMLTSDGNNFIKISAKLIARKDTYCLYVLEIENIFNDVTRNPIDLSVTDSLKNMFMLFNSVFIVDYENDMINSIYSDTKGFFKGGLPGTLREVKQEYVENMVAPEDQERYIDLINQENIYENLKKSKKGIYSNFFRTREKAGDHYEWKKHTIMVVPLRSEKKLLYSIEDADINRRDNLELFMNVYVHNVLAAEANDVEGVLGAGLSQEPDVLSREPEKLSKEPEEGNNEPVPNGDKEQALNGDNEQPPLKRSSIIGTSSLWNSFILGTQEKIFWKNADDEFIGASSAFLDYFNFKNLDELKNTASPQDVGFLGFNDNTADYYNKKVLKEGKYYTSLAARCMHEGSAVNVLVNLIPVFSRSGIQGMIGTLIDETSIRSFMNNAGKTVNTDFKTGLLNTRGLLNAVLDYSTEYHANGRKFGVILLSLKNYRKILNNYGEKIADEYISEAGRIIKENVGTHEKAGRITGDRFLIVHQYSSERELNDISRNITGSLWDLHNINGIPVNINPVFGIAEYDEFEDNESMIRAAKKRMLSRNR